MNDEEKDKLTQDIAGFLNELHSAPLPDIDGLEVNVIDDYKGDHGALKEMIYDKIPDRSREYLEGLYKRISGDCRISRYTKALCHNDMSCKHVIIRDNRAVGVIDFGDAAVTDRDRVFVYLLEDSYDECGREFGLKVLEYYAHTDKAAAIVKADLNDEYYPIEQILGGLSMGTEDMYNAGLNKIINIKGDGL